MTYTAEADFQIVTGAPEALSLAFGAVDASGTGFEELEFQVDLNGVMTTYDFTTLGSAESFFSGGPPAVGDVGAGTQTIDIVFDFTAAGDPPYFGVAFNAVGTPSVGTIPEASTWTMMLAGFAALGFAAFRKRRTSSAIV